MGGEIYRLVTIHRSGTDINLYGRSLTKKEKITVPFRPYFYVLSSGKSEFKDIFGNSVKIVYANDPSDVPNMRVLYAKHYEADVPYTRRFLIDKGIKSYFTHDENGVKPLDNSENIPLRVWYIDTEIFPGRGLPSAENPNQPVIALTIYDSYLKQYVSLASSENEKVDNNDNGRVKTAFLNEYNLLVFFSRLVIKFDPDIIVGWNVSFDVDYLKARCEKLKIPLDLSRCEQFDLLSAYRYLYRRPSYALRDIVRYENLGDYRWVTMQDLIKMDPSVLIEYNRNHVEPLVKLDEKLKLTDYYLSLKETAGFPHFEDMTHSKLLDTILLRLARKLNVILPSKPPEKEGEFYQGALVFQPKVGLFENVADIDISRCYPSIIRTFNISPETLITKPSDNDFKISSNIGFRRTPKGILSILVEDVWETRDQLEKSLRDLKPGTDLYKQTVMKRDLVKGLLNAVYGFTGYSKSRIYDVRLAETITKIAREVLVFLTDYFKSNNYNVLYGDTDSFFVQIPLEEAENLASKAETALSLYLKEKFNIDRNYITIKVDKFAKAIYFTGVKKKYAMHVIWEGRNCDYIDITGFESVRRDTPEFLQGLISNLLEMVLKKKPKEEVKSYLCKALSDYKNQPSLESICISKAITKPFSEYKVKPPHVRGAILANMYLKTNFQPGSRVKMLWVKHVKGIPKTDVICFETESDLPKDIEIDWDRMLDTTMKNRVEDILNPYGITWGEVYGNKESLNKWL